MSEAGHNSALTEGERKALMFHHFQAISIEKAKKDAANEEYKKARKLAKADGIVLADMDFMLRCSQLEDPDIVPAEIRRMAEIANWFALPVNYQPDMFTDRTPIEDRAFEEGKLSGMQGKNCDSPYDGTVGQKWIEGWHEGQRIMRDDLQSAMEKKNAEKSVANDDGDPVPFDDEELPDAAE